MHTFRWTSRTDVTQKNTSLVQCRLLDRTNDPLLELCRRFANLVSSKTGETVIHTKKSNSCTWSPYVYLGSPGVLQIGCLGMLWLTNAAAVPTTPPGRGDRAVSVGRSLISGWKVTLNPARNSEAGARDGDGVPKIMKKK